MRHGKKFNQLSRTNAHRKAMLANMASSLILHKRVKTTLAKAKALRSYVEPLITKSKNDSTHSRRTVFSYLQNKEAVTELFREISVRVAERPGGYTRILKLGPRLGDNAEMCLIELVDYNENLLGDKAVKTKKTRRRRGAGKKKEVGEPLSQVSEIDEQEEVDMSGEAPEEEAGQTEDKAPEVDETETAEEVKEEEKPETSVKEDSPESKKDEEKENDEEKKESPSEDKK